MDILIRDMNLSTVAKIDELAIEKGYKSRQDFLKVTIENIAFSIEEKSIENKYSELFAKVVSLLEKNSTSTTDIKLSVEVIDEFIRDTYFDNIKE